MMIKKKFFMNVLPAMLAFAFTGIYSIVDGWFVGQNIGDNGLAAINVAYPIIALILAVASGIGMSGAIHIGISKGAGEKEKEQRFLGNTVLLLVLSSVILTVGLGMTYPWILRMFGAEGELMELAVIYIKFILAGTFFQVMGSGLIPIIRNYDGAVLAMGAMITGFVVNVFLDWVLVSKMQLGMTGAAAATMVGQAVTMIPCVIFLFWKKLLIGYAKYTLKAGIIRDILEVGISPFGLTLSPNIVIIILNKGAVFYGGAAAVACYAVISYVIYVAQSLLQGIGDGAQPMISFYVGLERGGEIRLIRRMTYLFSFILAAMCMVWMYLGRNVFPGFFGMSEEVGVQAAEALPIFLVGLLFFAYTRATTAYFYAVKKNKYAYILIYGEPVVMAVLLVVILGPMLGVNGVWWTVPVTQMIMAGVGVVLAGIERKVQNVDIIDEIC